MNECNGQTRSDRIQQIGQMILASKKITDIKNWDGLSLVITLREGRGGSVHGFYYLKNGNFGATSTGQVGKTITEFHALRNIMYEETGERWCQALVHLTRPGPDINIKFEYDNPQRWKPSISGLDMTDYANSIKPPIG
ncbi:hypothetical protein [Acaryochloris sp. IP29b_bin.148]|uniref:hypothetical protein n=1 Tax=Acaryochloris sp. IP29b_bin.148 TaxID=2969218 RepID=UPI00260B6EC5|nr:hypothetical protein [Acaryochloris sp. IP29b_bin.148]